MVLFVTVPESREAEGFVVVKNTITAMGLDKSKLIGVTSDDKSANTGCRNGFSKLLRTYLARDVSTFWCIAYRSDFALENIEHAVSEI